MHHGCLLLFERVNMGTMWLVSMGSDDTSMYRGSKQDEAQLVVRERRTNQFAIRCDLKSVRCHDHHQIEIS